MYIFRSVDVPTGQPSGCPSTVPSLLPSSRPSPNPSSVPSLMSIELSGALFLQTFKVTASDGAESDEFGHSLSIWANVAVIGSRFDDNSALNSGA